MELLKIVEHIAPELNRVSNQDKYFSDPVLWAEDMMGLKFWSKQKEVVRSLVTSKNVAVKAGHGLGKVSWHRF